LYFSEPVRPFADGIAVLGPDGRRADRGSVKISSTELSIDVDAAAQGTYLVRWRILSSDSHPARGQFNFSVGTPSPPRAGTAGAAPDIDGVAVPGLVMQVIAGWLHFAGYTLGFGTLGFALLLQRRPRQVASLPALRRLALAGVLGMLAGAGLALAAQLESLDPSLISDPDTIGDLLGSSFGPVWTLQVCAALLLWVLIAPIAAGSRVSNYAAVLVGVALAFVDGAVAHAGSAGSAWLGFPISAVHFMAMAIWLGGFALLLRRRASSSSGESLQPWMRISLIAATTVAISGAVMAWLHLSKPADLAITGYGRTIVAKILIFALIAASAWLAIHLGRSRRGIWRRIEAAGMIAALALAALLVATRPPR
jgi:copper transport protein